MAENVPDQNLKRIRTALQFGIPAAVALLVIFISSFSSGDEAGEENAWIENLGWFLVVTGIGCVFAGAFLNDKIKQMGKPAIVAGIIFLIYSIPGIQDLVDAGVDTIDKSAAEEANELRAGRICPTEPSGSNHPKKVLPEGDTELLLTSTKWTPWLVISSDTSVGRLIWKWDQEGLCIATLRKGYVRVIEHPAGKPLYTPHANAYAFASMGPNMELVIPNVRYTDK